MQWFQSAGISIAFQEFSPAPPSNEPPVLLIHGFASNSALNWVTTSWTSLLCQLGRRVIVFDNRGHGKSDKPLQPEAYHLETLASDPIHLLDYLGIEVADFIGYSMGARIAAFCALKNQQRVRRLVLGGLGMHLVEGDGLLRDIEAAMLAPTLDDLSDPQQRLFRSFAQTYNKDLAPLAACISGSTQKLSPEQVASIKVPTLVAIGTNDDIAGSAQALADLFPNAIAFAIEGRDHNMAVGDRSFKNAVVEFLK